ncbi:hypothetical protein T492DRAFT_985111 [Pavlovales sp. CCMP2436]|nr:hypothetical protein T492DRAFT_985111 [Pavlovales sp. CCMP2436]
MSPTADVGRLAVGVRVQVYWREYEEWFDAVVKAYIDSRHHVLYEDGQEDIGIIDGRKLWLLEDDKWTSLRLRWKDEDLHLVADLPTLDKSEPEAAGDKNGDGKAAAQPEEKADAHNKDGWQAPSENVGGFMIGCDICDKWYYGGHVDITEHEAKDIKKYICPKCVIESARKRGGKGTNKRLRTVATKISTS